MHMSPIHYYKAGERKERKKGRNCFWGASHGALIKARKNTESTAGFYYAVQAGKLHE